MKKVILTTGILMVGAMTVMAQVTPTEEGEQAVEQQIEETSDAVEELEYERLSDEPEEGYMDEDMDMMRVEGVEEVEMGTLPIEVQQSFSEGEYGDWKVVKAHKVAGDAMNPDESYKIMIVSEDMQEDIEDLEGDVSEEVEEGAQVAHKEVKVKVPALVLHYDKNGQLLSAEEENEE